MSFVANSDPLWKDGVFVEPYMEKHWRSYPRSLQQAALVECSLGNRAIHIQRDTKQGVTVLVLERPPLAPAPANVEIHRQFFPGNHCYDDTECTYQDVATQSILAFSKASAAQQSAPADVPASRGRG